MSRFDADRESSGPLAAFLRGKLPDRSWRRIKDDIAAGRVSIDGRACADPGAHVAAGQEVHVAESAPRAPAGPAVRLVHLDSQVVVIDKPEGVMSVPYERGDRGTAMDLARLALRRSEGRESGPLFVVHRIDKDTSGLMVFARTRRAETALGTQFRAHHVDRIYLCVAHGRVPGDARIESRFVPDRGDGLRGSTMRPGGKTAITHVRVQEHLAGATACEVKLETGRTHQVRIHLAESGHPLVGETVYIRDWLREGLTPLPSSRLLLHALTLGFAHPISAAPLDFRSEPPVTFLRARDALK